jgi:hypothetical protein
MIGTPEQAPLIRPSGLDMKVLLSTEATGEAISVIMAWQAAAGLAAGSLIAGPGD